MASSLQRFFELLESGTRYKSRSSQHTLATKDSKLHTKVVVRCTLTTSSASPNTIFVYDQASSGTGMGMVRRFGAHITLRYDARKAWQVKHHTHTEAKRM